MAAAFVVECLSAVEKVSARASSAPPSWRRAVSLEMAVFAVETTGASESNRRD